MNFDGTNRIAVTKEVTFDCAHLLTDYEGKCSNLHGHTYKLQVTLAAFIPEMNTQKKCAEASSWKDCGMVIDFNDLKKSIEKIAISKFDHVCILNALAAKDSLEMKLKKLLEENHSKLLLIHGRTTCENLARVIFDEFTIKLAVHSSLCAFNVVVEKVVLYETPTSFATVERRTR